MSDHSEPSRQPAAVSGDHPPEFESGKGCLMLSVFCVACLVLMLVVVLVFGDTAV